MPPEDQSNPVRGLSGYELGHLVAHLTSAGRTKEVHRLLRLQTTTGRNAWFEAKEAGYVRSYVDDVVAAWDLVQVESAALAAAGGQIPTLGLEYRYALIRASVTSLADP
jgi:hypothetical protein